MRDGAGGTMWTKEARRHDPGSEGFKDIKKRRGRFGETRPGRDGMRKKVKASRNSGEGTIRFSAQRNSQRQRGR